MSTPVDEGILGLSVIIADVLVFAGWVSAAIFIAIWVNRRVARLTAQLAPDKATEPGGIRFLLYAVGVMFWPAALVLAILFLAKPESAATGRVCVWLVMMHFTIAVIAAIGIVTWAAFAHPSLFGWMG